nr:MAG TPA: hypothetical protein [Caudoviricetes sp.]
MPSGFLFQSTKYAQQQVLQQISFCCKIFNI